MAAAQERNNSQGIYEGTMDYCSFIISHHPAFNLQEISAFMQHMYLNQIKEQGKPQIEGYYQERRADLKTRIDDFTYDNLSSIFLDSIDSILESNKNNPFSQLRANRNVYATEEEQYYSQFNNSNIQEPPARFALTLKHRNPRKPIRSKYSFKYSPNVAGIKLTNKTLNKYIKNFTHQSNKVNYKPYTSARNNEKRGSVKNGKMKGRITRNYNVLNRLVENDLIKIYTTLEDGSKLHTSTLRLDSRYKNVNIKEQFGFATNSFSLVHTSPEHIPRLLHSIESLWARLQPGVHPLICYAIHWLFAIACPYRRGSAGCAKMLLNAALIKINLPIVKESPQYARKTDWVAMFSPSLEIYHTKIADMFINDEEGNRRIEEYKRLALLEAQ
jgi:hypothetical protein